MQSCLMVILILSLNIPLGKKYEQELQYEIYIPNKTKQVGLSLSSGLCSEFFDRAER